MGPISPRDYLNEANSSETTAKRLDSLARAEWEFVRAAVAANPKTDPQTLVKLVPAGIRLLDESIAVAIARRVDAPAEALRALARRFNAISDWSGRSAGVDLGLALLSNPSTPNDAIVELLAPARSTPHFRARVATTTRLASVLTLLRQDISEKVRKRAERALERLRAGE